MESGNKDGLFKIVQATLFRKELGSDFALRKNDNKLLGLEEEDLDTVIRGVFDKST